MRGLFVAAFLLLTQPAWAVQPVNLGALEDAEAELPEDDPDKPDLIFRIAEEYAERARMNRAMATAAKKPADEKRFRAAADADRGKAIGNYGRLVGNKAYRNFPRLDEALWRLAPLETETGADARPRYQRIIKEYSASQYVPGAWVALGDLDFGDGKLAEADASYARAMKYPKADVYAYAIYKHGWVAFNLGKPKDSFAAWLKVFQLLAKDAAQQSLRDTALIDSTRAYAAFGDPKKAWAVYKRVDATRAPKMITKLAQAWRDGAEDAKAKIVLTDALKRAPNDPEAAAWQAMLSEIH